MARKNNKTGDAETTDRQRKVWEMYCSRMTMTMISDHLKIGLATVHRDVTAVRKAYEKEMIQTADKMMKRELSMLDRLERKAQAQMAATQSVKWMHTILKISERRCKLLGLDSTTVNLDIQPPVALGWATPEEMEKAAKQHKGK